MPLYIGDYLASTSRLTTEQHGAYLLLIMDYWKNGPPPDDDAILSQICRMNANAWSNASSTIRAFFKQCNGHLVHSRIDREIATAKDKKDAFVAKARDAAKVRWDKHASSTSQALLGSCPSPSPLPTPSESTSQSTSESPDSKSTPKSKPLQPASPVARKKQVSTIDETTLQAVCKETWKAYSEAFSIRYGIPPTRNAQINSQVKQFCQKVPADEAPAIAAFYVRHNASKYVAAGHSVGFLVADAAPKLRTEWATNQTITATQAQQADRTQANGNVWGKVIAGIEERERNAAIG